MFKKIVLLTLLNGFLIVLTACSSPTVSDQAELATEIPPLPTPMIEFLGIRLSADGSGDYPDLKTAIASVEAGETLVLEAGTYRLNEKLEIEPSHQTVCCQR